MFTPVETSIGALLLHEASTAMLQDHGRVLGISGILDGALASGMAVGEQALKQRDTKGKTKDAGAASTAAAAAPSSVENSFRPVFLAGMLVAPAMAGLTGLGRILPDQGEAIWAGMSLARLAVAGALVGLGSKLGSGCTSGHMLCGLSRLSQRSIVSVATFFPIAILMAHAVPSPVPFPKPYGSTIGSSFRASELLPSLQAALLLGVPVLAYPVIRSFLLRPGLNRLNAQSKVTRVLRHLPYFLIGLVFSLGLLISGMSSPLKVLSFLRFPNWDSFDPSLALVMLFGVVPNALQYFNTKHSAFFKWESWKIPTRRDIDWKLLTGAAAFGAGWGLAGVCPGPAITAAGSAFARAIGLSIGSGTSSLVPADAVARGVSIFLASTVAGMSLVRVCFP